MRNRILLALLLLVCSTIGLAQDNPEAQFKQRTSKFKNSKRFNYRHDKFRDLTLISTGPFMLTGAPTYISTGSMFDVSAAFAFKGRDMPTAPGTLFQIAFGHEGKDWVFLNARDIYFLVDGERLQLGEGNRTSDIGRRKVTERLAITIPAEQFTKIANGKKVEAKAGAHEFEIKEEHLQAFRDLISLTQSQ